MKLSVALLSIFCFQPLLAQNFWQPLTTPYAGTVLCIGHSSDDILYAGTESNGLYSSTDDGESWRFIGLSDNPVTAIAVTYKGYIFTYQPSVGIRRSTDGGSIWTIKNTGIENILVHKIISDGRNYLFAATDAGCYRSTDNGGHWVPVNAGLTNIRLSDITVNVNEYLYASSYRGGIFTSTDAGNGWTQINYGLTSGSILSITVDLFGNVYAGADGNGIYQTSDMGSNWYQIYFDGTWPLLTIDQHQNLYAVDDFNETFYTSNNGVTWLNFATDTLHTTINAINSNTTGSVFLGTTSRGIFRAASQNDSWTPKGLPAINGTSFLETSTGKLLMTTSNGFTTGGGGFISSDHGNTWKTTSLRGIGLSSLIKLTGSNIIASGQGGVYQSTNNGSSWVQHSTPGQITAIAAGNNNYLFASFNSTGVYYSSDEGATWLPGGLDTHTINSIASDSTGAVYACTADGLFRSPGADTNWVQIPIDPTETNTFAFKRIGTRLIAATSDGIFYSDNNGVSWTSSISSSLARSVRKFATFYHRDIFAATSVGVLRSFDQGSTWDHITFGLESMNCFSIGIDNDGYLYTGTPDGGTYRSMDHLLEVGNLTAGIPGTFHLYQNFPNPFNPSTRIRYDLTQRGHVSIKLYDELGRELQTLVNEVKNAGSYTVEVKAEELSSGVYFYRIISGNNTSVQKMVIVR